MSAVGVLLLAAGGSVRMGRPKQLLPFRGTTLLRNAAQVALESGLGRVIVVLGAEATACERALVELPITIVTNPSWPEGMGGSIRLGLETLLRLDPDVAAVLITLHDQPFVPAARLRDLVAAWAPPESLAVASAYAGTFGVPALFDRQLFTDLVALTGQHGAHRTLLQHSAQLAKIEIPEAGFDIDAPADYQRLLAADAGLGDAVG